MILDFNQNKVLCKSTRNNKGENQNNDYCDKSEINSVIDNLSYKQPKSSNPTLALLKINMNPSTFVP